MFGHTFRVTVQEDQLSRGETNILRLKQIRLVCFLLIFMAQGSHSTSTPLSQIFSELKREATKETREEIQPLSTQARDINVLAAILLKKLAGEKNTIKLMTPS